MVDAQLLSILDRLKTSDFNKRQLNILTSVLDELQGDSSKVAELNRIKAKAGTGIGNDIHTSLVEVFRIVDIETLKKFNDFSMENLLLSKEDVESFRGKLLPWPQFLQDKLSEKFDEENLSILIEALKQVFHIKTTGFGKGELLISILTQGFKGREGDVGTSFGELEIKADGRVISVKVPRGDSAEAEREIFKIADSFEELKQLDPIIWDITAHTKKSGPYTPNSSNIKNIYEPINTVLSPERRKEFWKKFVDTYVKVFHVNAVRENIVDITILDMMVEKFVENEIEDAIVLLGALQFDIYRRADNFDYLFLISEDNIFIIKTINDIIGKASVLKSDKPLKMDAPVIGPEGQQANMTRYRI